MNIRLPKQVLPSATILCQLAAEEGGLDQWCNDYKDVMTDSHFPRFFGGVVQCEKRSKSSSLYSFWKYRYFKWGSLLNPNGFEFVIFLYIICETFRSKQEEFTKLHVNLREIWRKFKCRKNCVRPPLLAANDNACIYYSVIHIYFLFLIPSRATQANLVRQAHWDSQDMAPRDRKEIW